jgi:hypothetical protein
MNASVVIRQWHSFHLVVIPPSHTSVSIKMSKTAQLGRLIVEVTSSHAITHTHTHTHTHKVGLLWTSDQVVADAATYTTHNKHKRQTSMTSVGFKPAIPANKWSQTYALYGTASFVIRQWHGYTATTLLLVPRSWREVVPNEEKFELNYNVLQYKQIFVIQTSYTINIL